MTFDKFNLSKPQCCTCTLPTVSPCTCPLDFPRPFCHKVLINSCLLKSWGNCIYFSHRSVPLVAKRFIYHFSHRTRNISRVMPQKRQEQEKRLGGFMGYWMMVGGSFLRQGGRKGLKAKGQGNNAMQNFWQAWDRKNGAQVLAVLQLWQPLGSLFFFIRFFVFFFFFFLAALVLSIVGTNSYGTLLPLYNILMPP